MKIGPTFSAELAAAGVSLDGLAWDPVGGGITAWASDGQLSAAQTVLMRHDPTKQLPPTVSGNQWAFAIADLGLASAWRVGVTKSKDSDQTRAGLIARDTPLVASDPLLIRIAANAGNDAAGNPLIAVPAIFAHAQGMPT